MDSLDQRLQIEIAERKRLERHLSVLAAASRAFGAPIDHASTVHVIATIAVEHLADWAVVCLAHDAQVTAEEIQHKPHLRTDAMWSLAWDLIDGSELIHLAMRDEHVIVDERDGSSIAIAPLLARGQALGVLIVGSETPHRYDANERALIEELGRRGGAALETAYLFETEHLTNERLSDAVERQQDADRRKDEFLAILGHELRNPLAPILTALELMDLRGETHCEREREVIKRQASHLARLVEDLLDVSRVMREKIQLRRESLELASVIGQAIEVVSPLLEERRHTLINGVPRTGMRVYADNVRLGQVFANLLTNAAKYTEPGGRISIFATQVEDTLEIVIEDNGMGIAPELLPQMFEPFIQSERTIDRARGGLGLGLSLVRSLTQLHGGTVSAHSHGPGTGSRFTIQLPVAGVVVSDDDENSTGRMSSLAAPSGRVLVVDDNVDAADMLASVLRNVGYEVAVAHDAPGALNIATEFRPKFALLDLGLPVMDGYELARHLRERFPDAPPRLVAVSGYGQDSDIAKSRAAGFDSHLGKPVSLDVLVNVLGHLQATEHMK